MEIGERLKEAREEQNLSLESLQETTKIQKRYLEAIEQGNFKILPGTFYARAFIKEYASAVGLDPNELLEEYKEDLPQTEKDNTAHYSQIHRSRKDNNPSKNTNVFSFIPTVIVVLLVIGIIFIVWLFLQDSFSEDSTQPADTRDDNEIIRDSDNDNQGDGQTEDDGSAGSDAENDSQSDNNGDENTDTESVEPEDSQPEFVVEEEGTGNAPESTLTLENANDDSIATIEATGEGSWLDVQNDAGESLFSGMVTADNSPVEVDLSGVDRVWFSVGSAPALDITIDGTTLEYPVNPDEEVFQKIWINIDRAGE